MTPDELIQAINTLAPQEAPPSAPTSDRSFHHFGDPPRVGAQPGNFIVPPELITSFEQLIQPLLPGDYLRFLVRLTKDGERWRLISFNRAALRSAVFAAKMKELHEWKETASKEELDAVYGAQPSDVELLDKAKRALESALDNYRLGHSGVAVNHASDAITTAIQFVVRYRNVGSVVSEDYDNCKHCGEPLKQVRCMLCGEVCD